MGICRSSPEQSQEEIDELFSLLHKNVEDDTEENILSESEEKLQQEKKRQKREKKEKLLESQLKIKPFVLIKLTHDSIIKSINELNNIFDKYLGINCPINTYPNHKRTMLRLLIEIDNYFTKLNKIIKLHSLQEDTIYFTLLNEKYENIIIEKEFDKQHKKDLNLRYSIKKLLNDILEGSDQFYSKEELQEKFVLFRKLIVKWSEYHKKHVSDEDELLLKKAVKIAKPLLEQGALVRTLLNVNRNEFDTKMIEFVLQNLETRKQKLMFVKCIQYSSTPNEYNVSLKYIKLGLGEDEFDLINKKFILDGIGKQEPEIIESSDESIEEEKEEKTVSKEEVVEEDSESYVEEDELSLKYFSREEVAKHNTKNSAWIILNNQIYDVTAFTDHPGSHAILLKNAGTDKTEAFINAGHPMEAFEWAEQFLIGNLIVEDESEENVEESEQEEEEYEEETVEEDEEEDTEIVEEDSQNEVNVQHEEENENVKQLVENDEKEEIREDNFNEVENVNENEIVQSNNENVKQKEEIIEENNDKPPENEEEVIEDTQNNNINENDEITQNNEQNVKQIEENEEIIEENNNKQQENEEQIVENNVSEEIVQNDEQKVKQLEENETIEENNEQIVEDDQNENNQQNVKQIVENEEQNNENNEIKQKNDSSNEQQNENENIDILQMVDEVIEEDSVEINHKQQNNQITNKNENENSSDNDENILYVN